MVHKNLNRPETSLTPFDLLNKNRVYYNIKRHGTTSMVIPCLCLFTVPSGASAGTCRGGAPPSCCANVFLLGRTCPRPCWERVRQTGIVYFFILGAISSTTVTRTYKPYSNQVMVLFQGKLISGWFTANIINATAIISITKPTILDALFFM